MDKYMFANSFIVIFLVLNAMRNEASSLKGFYGIKTNEHPKSSCHEIPNIISTSLATCGMIMDEIIMFSHDESTKSCLCCNDITGKNIIGSNLKTYVPRK